MSYTMRTGLPLALVAMAACQPPGPESAAPMPDRAPALVLGPPDSLLFQRDEAQRSAYRNIDRIFPTREIEASGEPFSLPSRPVDLSDVTFEVGNEAFDLESFVQQTNIVGLLVLKDGQIALERYERGHAPDSRWISYSISKSVVSLLTGAALKDGYIRSLEDRVSEYVPILEGTAYEAVTIRDALQMASGVEWTDGYNDIQSDFNRSLTTPTVEQLGIMGRRPRLAEPGERFNYNSGETHLVATVLRAAIGNNLATYLSNKIWGPFGMEFDANWMLVEEGGGEHGGCCISSTLRDYGRLGLFAMRGGVLPNRESVLVDGWMDESTTPSAANPGYGYLWWLRSEGAHAAIGVFGQVISIDPAENLVVVTNSAWPGATQFFGHVYAFAAAVRDALR